MIDLSSDRGTAYSERNTITSFVLSVIDLAPDNESVFSEMKYPMKAINKI